jgi:hypothetical protein
MVRSKIYFKALYGLDIFFSAGNKCGALLLAAEILDTRYMNVSVGL